MRSYTRRDSLRLPDAQGTYATHAEKEIILSLKKQGSFLEMTQFFSDLGNPPAQFLRP